MKLISIETKNSQQMSLNKLVKSQNSHAVDFYPEYGTNNLSNHFPMTIFALKQLGADHEDIKRYSKLYLAQLDKTKNKVNIKITPLNFEKYLGKREAYLGYYSYFDHIIEKDKTLPMIDVLLSGLSAGAFHAIIRLGYGLDAGNVSEIIAGLAYLADSYQEVFRKRNSRNTLGNNTSKTYKEILEKYLKNELPKLNLSGIIYEKMKQVSRHADYNEMLFNVFNSCELNISQLAECNLNLYLRTNNFTALHTVTATHAARLILPYVSDPHLLVSNLAAASICAFLTIPSNAFCDILKNDSNILLPDIISKSIKSMDDHNIKMTYTCIKECEFYQNNNFLLAAHRRLTIPVSF